MDPDPQHCKEIFRTINDPSPLSAAPLKKKRGRPRKIKVEDEDESFAEPLVTFKVKDLKVWWPHATLFYVYFSFMRYITHGSHHIVVMRLGQARF